MFRQLLPTQLVRASRLVSRAAKKNKKKGGKAAGSNINVEAVASELGFDVEPHKAAMLRSLDKLKKELTSLRTGKASTSLLDALTIDAYGTRTPLNQVSQIAVRDAQQLELNIFDPELVPEVQDALLNSDLGLNPQVDETRIRVKVPKLNKEIRQGIAKQAHAAAEKAKNAIRGTRKKALDKVKADADDRSKDDTRKLEQAIQSLTDEHIDQATELAKNKEEDILNA